ncbi:MAG TPA: hypothetical protein VLU96_01765, partial [Gaiellaceae bacterium]|nr:hypothetical protein [Gaiellaceae bacterium]
MATVTTPPPPRSDELEALIEEARQRQRRRRQRIGVALVLATALLGVVTYAVVAVVGSTSLRSGSQPTSAPAGAGRPRIVFAANRVAVLYGEIYSVGLDGRRTNLSRSAARDIAPAVSPDGKRVAFLSDRHGGVALYAARLHGGSLVKLSPYLFPPYSAGGLDGQVAWSPDGRRIAVAAQSPASAALYLGGMNGRGKVIDTEFTDELAWSSDGRLLAYRAHLYPSAAAAGAPVKVGGPARRAGGLRVVDTDGAAAWHVNSIDPRSLAWSSTGRLAVGLERKTRVYDARGRVLSSFPGTAFGSPWSPSGDRLASLRRGRLEIRRGGTGRPVVSLRAAGQG